MTTPRAKDEKPKEVEYLYTVTDVAKYFRVTEQTVRLWITDKRLQAYREPPKDGDKNVPPRERRSTLYITKRALMDWAEIYYKL